MSAVSKVAVPEEATQASQICIRSYCLPSVISTESSEAPMKDESISIGIVEARGMKNWQSAFWESCRAASSITGRSPATSFLRLPGMRRIRFLFGSPWK